MWADQRQQKGVSTALSSGQKQHGIKNEKRDGIITNEGFSERVIGWGVGGGLKEATFN